MPLPSDATPVVSPPLMRLLAIETSTDQLSVAVGSGAPDGPLWHYTGPGGAQASARLLPVVHDLLNQAGWRLQELDAVVFGRGPGSFTGLRTACAVAQGLAYGAGGLPVLPVDTLLALAEQARLDLLQKGQPLPGVIVALLDARMHEIYVAPYACHATGLMPLQPPRLCAPQDLNAYLEQVLSEADGMATACLLAGNVFEVYSDALRRGSLTPTVAQHTCLPSATGLLQLAPGLLAAGGAVAAREAVPLYVRDKVAQTTAERETVRLAHLAQVPASAEPQRVERAP